MKTVSLVIPTLSGKKTIENTLRSALGESDIGEIVICVNGNFEYSEFCKELATKYPDLPIHVFLNGSTTLSMPMNWTYATKLATLPFIRIVCDDDEIVQGSTNHLLKILESCEEASFVGGRRRIVSGSGATLIKAIGYRGSRRIFSAKQAIIKCSLLGTTIFGEPSAILFRRDHLVESMPWTSSHPYVIDLAMCLKVLTSNNSVGMVTSTVVSTFQVHADSLSSNLSKIQSSDFVSLIREYKEHLKPFGVFWLTAARIKSSLRMYARRLFYLRLRTSKLGRLETN
jgi:glycosyltransferase involved in cell wall biosynthesis